MSARCVLRRSELSLPLGVVAIDDTLGERERRVVVWNRDRIHELRRVVCKLRAARGAVVVVVGSPPLAERTTTKT